MEGSARESVEEVIQALSINYPEIDWKNDVDEGLMVKADQVHFKNLIFNLLENAAKYGGSKVEISSDTQSLVISDDGPGVSTQDQTQVFKKFYRSSVGSKKRKGFGLGLYYVKQVVDAHNWKVSFVHSILGGASIKISLKDEG